LKTRATHIPPVEPRGRQRACAACSPRALRRGFTLVEILIVVVVLGILATVVIPQFSSASQQARQNTLKEELQYLRTQITVFKAQHVDVPPGYPGGNPTSTPTTTDFSNQMTECSDVSFDLSQAGGAAYPYGPYLSQLPVNPVNGFNTFKMVGNNQAFPAADGTTGWIYQPQTQQIIANVVGNDDSGEPYSSY
jgi:general secretion pathway protein G